MSEERKKVGVGFWIVIAAVAVLAYPISLGPACWISSRFDSGTEFVSQTYGPAIRISDKGPEFVGRFSRWYSELGAAENWAWVRYDDIIETGHDAKIVEVVSWQQVLGFM